MVSVHSSTRVGPQHERPVERNRFCHCILQCFRRIVGPRQEQPLPRERRVVVIEDSRRDARPHFSGPQLASVDTIPELRSDTPVTVDTWVSDHSPRGEIPQEEAELRARQFQELGARRRVRSSVAEESEFRSTAWVAADPDAVGVFSGSSDGVVCSGAEGPLSVLSGSEISQMEQAARTKRVSQARQQENQAEGLRRLEVMLPGGVPGSVSKEGSRLAVRAALFRKFPGLEGMVEGVKLHVADPESFPLDRLQKLFGNPQPVAKLSKVEANVILGSGERGSAGLYLGKDPVAMRVAKVPPEQDRSMWKQLSIVQANEGTGFSRYHNPHYFFDYCLLAPGDGVKNWSFTRKAMSEVGDEEDVATMFSKLWKSVDAALLREDGSEGVYIHCLEGKDRSACVVLLYLINRLGLSAEEAKIFLKLKRPCVEPVMLIDRMPGYAEALQKIDSMEG